MKIGKKKKKKLVKLKGNLTNFNRFVYLGKKRSEHYETSQWYSVKSFEGSSQRLNEKSSSCSMTNITVN